jgi:hypothetical protein
MNLQNATKKTWIYKDLVYIKPLELLRKTPSVEFYHVKEVFKDLGAIDKVVHAKGAISPNIKGMKGDNFWYMHNYQEDNLLVHEGKRLIDLYSKKHGKIERFEVTSNYVKHNGKIIYKGEAIVGWPKFVFHRIKSPNGSISTNYAKHYKNFDIKTNFNIYSLDEKTGESVILREGHKDQPKKKK